MIAVDTSTLIAFLAGEKGRDTEALDAALAHNEVSLPPVVVTEVLSATRADERLGHLIVALPMLAVTDGYWRRAGELRARLHARKLKAPLADALIAQSCLDHGVALLTRDADFRHFAKHGGLTLF